MKPSWQWNEEDILALTRDQIKESITLDYKACGSLERKDSKKAEISKDVSAFANSAGGTIVYGMVENGHVPTAIDTGFDPNEMTKEWLEQVISSTIQRRIDGIRINQIELTTTNPGRVLYVVFIPQSHRAPHMASDNRFYKRFNFESRPMEEYEVRDVSRRLQAPDLKLTPITQLVASGDGTYTVSIDFSISNSSATPAEYTLARVWMPQQATIESRGEFENAGRSVITSGNFQIPVQALIRKLGIPGWFPIWEGVAFRVSESPITIKLPHSGVYNFGWQLDSPGMSTKSRIYQLWVADDHLTVLSSDSLSDSLT